MRLTTRTNLATRVLMACAANEGQLIRTTDVAERCNASANHLLQVTNRLNAFGFIEAIRGRGGGIKLARPMEQITVGSVFRAFEAEIPITECFDEGNNTCPLREDCRLFRYLQKAVDAFYHELDMVTLADLVKGNCGLRELLSFASATLAVNCDQAPMSA